MDCGLSLLPAEKPGSVHLFGVVGEGIYGIRFQSLKTVKLWISSGSFVCMWGGRLGLSSDQYTVRFEFGRRPRMSKKGGPPHSTN